MACIACRLCQVDIIWKRNWWYFEVKYRGKKMKLSGHKIREWNLKNIYKNVITGEWFDEDTTTTNDNDDNYNKEKTERKEEKRR